MLVPTIILFLVFRRDLLVRYRTGPGWVADGGLLSIGGDVIVMWLILFLVSAFEVWTPRWRRRSSLADSLRGGSGAFPRPRDAARDCLGHRTRPAHTALAGAPGRLVALLMGVDVGSLVSPWAYLAALRCHERLVALATRSLALAKG